MGRRNYYQNNLSAFDGDIDLVETKMRQIIQEQDEGRERYVKARQNKAWRFRGVIFAQRGFLKSKKARSSCEK